MKIALNEFEIKRCDESDLESILELQDETFACLDMPDLLRKNDPEMLSACLKEPHITIGAWYKGELAAFSVLYFPGDGKENLQQLLTDTDLTAQPSANYKLCIVKPKYRGNSLQYELGSRLISVAEEAGVGVICATASPYNHHSIRNIEKMGFKYNRTLEKYGYIRNLYFKVLEI